MKAKSAADSAITTSELVLPQHTNAHGSIFGGVVMSWIDITASIAARRHSGKLCVTASVDEMHFLRPIRLGDIVIISAKLAAVHKTSCEVHVSVWAEALKGGIRTHTTDATLTFVALDESGKPTEIPPLLLTTAEEKKAQAEADKRKTERDQNRREMMKRNGG